MKKLILLTLLAVITAGCIENGSEISKSSKIFVDVTYDSCEYVVSNATERMAHKGNCKFCAERDSLEWEKRKAEIVELLKRESID